MAREVTKNWPMNFLLNMLWGLCMALGSCGVKIIVNHSELKYFVVAFSSQRHTRRAEGEVTWMIPSAKRKVSLSVVI